ncbi:DUF3237 domain-containing protein [Aerosakkonema sp. BLCC-F183]|uniref:DUF3237 domain-containing protein n=1 Tax=Aerosakkonema sp. BLCC-F183 TaxID=3342834 RepID=UPI0035BA898E
MFDYSLEHLFSYTITLKNPIEFIGPVPEGIRANAYFVGGLVKGPKMNGKVLPGGGDWVTIRPDGVGLIDVRATFETDDGALIYTNYLGVYDLGEDGYQKFLNQAIPQQFPLRIAPRYHTVHPNYKWLNRLHCIGIGQAFLERSEVEYDIYAVR